MLLCFFGRGLAEAAIFEFAFRLGARLTMEVQTDEEEQQNSKSGIGERSDAILFGAYQGKRKETP